MLLSFYFPKIMNGCGRLWKSRSDFQGAVGAFLASTAPSASIASVVRGARALAESIALAGHLYDRRVGEEPVQDRGRRRHIAEKDTPVLRRSIRGDQCRCGFVTTDEDLEEILGGVRSELLHAEIFQHEQVDAGQLLDEIAAGARRLRLREVGGEIEGAPYEGTPARANRTDGDRRGDVRFADTWRSDEEHAAVALDEARARQFDNLRLGNFGIEGPVEIGERLQDADAGLLQSPREEAIGAPHELILDEQFEKFEMWQR